MNKNKRNILVYISGAYTGEVHKNILKAKKIAVEVWEKGFTALCPHLNMYKFDSCCSCSYEDYMDGSLVLLSKCDVILFLDNWKNSSGAKVERAFALENKIPQFYSVKELNDYFNNFPHLIK